MYACYVRKKWEMWLQKCKMDKEKTMQCMWILNTNDAWKQIWSKILETKNFPISIGQASIKYQLSQAEARLENSRNFLLIENHVRTYVFHMLRTYVMILCNWLILWQNALYLYFGRLRMCLNTSRNYVSRSSVEAFKSVQEIK